MGSLAFTLAPGGFGIWPAAELGTFADEILGKVRESVQASELLEIDRYISVQSALGDDPNRKPHAPLDQQDFERVVSGWLTASGNRDVTRDRWGEPFVYFKFAT